jgi:hypothetical protein
MDKHKFAWIWEGIKMIFGLAVLYYYGDWFGSDKLFPGLTYILLGYFLLSFGVGLWMKKNELSAVPS